ncbi:MAG: glutamate-1-semialdehyde 2,1-aminomutase [Deltaproteobacteria bacterium]|nr:glutamate-1-semialdehyde 2,1-aminomutase [Deltaproteobacteria bacterium]
MSTGPLSKELFNAAKNLMPGGVNSPVRSFASVGGEPFFVEKAKGAILTDADGNDYIDYVMSYGPLILGHAHEDVLRKVQTTMARGLTFGAPNGLEIELAKLICDRVPSVEMVRFVSSGTEATMSAIRLARGATNRSKIVKFHGNYHGHGDSFLVQAGSGVAQHGIAGSPGVPEDIVSNTISLAFNDIEQLKQVLAANSKQIAAIIVEPVCGNMGVVLPKEGYLQTMRELCDQHDIVLIFDEVMTGFRVSRGGAQEYFGVTPDLTCMGKIIGGGMPVGAYGGNEKLMKQVAPVGPVYQAGTLSGNPVCMAAGIKTLKLLKDREVYQTLEYRTKFLRDEMVNIAQHHDVPLTVNHIGSMMTPFFTDRSINNFEDVKATNQGRYQKYFHYMLDEGVFIPPSPFEAWFLSIAHTEELLKQTVQAHEAAIKKL